jgi:uridine kinase
MHETMSYRLENNQTQLKPRLYVKDVYEPVINWLDKPNFRSVIPSDISLKNGNKISGIIPNCVLRTFDRTFREQENSFRYDLLCYDANGKKIYIDLNELQGINVLREVYNAKSDIFEPVIEFEYYNVSKKKYTKCQLVVQDFYYGTFSSDLIQGLLPDFYFTGYDPKLDPKIKPNRSTQRQNAFWRIKGLYGDVLNDTEFAKKYQVIDDEQLIYLVTEQANDEFKRVSKDFYKTIENIDTDELLGLLSNEILSLKEERFDRFITSPPILVHMEGNGGSGKSIISNRLSILLKQYCEVLILRSDNFNIGKSSRRTPVTKRSGIPNVADQKDFRLYLKKINALLRINESLRNSANSGPGVKIPAEYDTESRKALAQGKWHNLYAPLEVLILDANFRVTRENINVLLHGVTEKHLPITDLHIFLHLDDIERYKVRCMRDLNDGRAKSKREVFISTLKRRVEEMYYTLKDMKDADIIVEVVETGTKDQYRYTVYRKNVFPLTVDNKYL